MLITISKRAAALASLVAAVVLTGTSANAQVIDLRYPTNRSYPKFQSNYPQQQQPQHHQSQQQYQQQQRFNQYPYPQGQPSVHQTGHRTRLPIRRTSRDGRVSQLAADH